MDYIVKYMVTICTRKAVNEKYYSLPTCKLIVKKKFGNLLWGEVNNFGFA